MNKISNLRALMVSQGLAPLTEDKEGKLRGGFIAVTAVSNNCDCTILPNNCKCNGNNCDCPPEPTVANADCACNGNNCDCQIAQEPPQSTETTSAPTSAMTTAVGIDSLAGFWPGLI